MALNTRTEFTRLQLIPIEGNDKITIFTIGKTQTAGNVWTYTYTNIK